MVITQSVLQEDNYFKYNPRRAAYDKNYGKHSTEWFAYVEF